MIRTAPLFLLIIAGLVVCGAAQAQKAALPEINAGQVQKRIPRPVEEKPPAPELRTPVPPAEAPAVPLRFVLTGVVIDGATAFPASELAVAYEPYLAREVGQDDIRKILEAITRRYRDDGYFLSRAIARPQALSQGILHVTVIEGYVRRLIFQDATAEEKADLSPYFAGIVGRRPLRLMPLERALLLVNDIPGLVIGRRLKAESAETGAYDLVLKLRQQRFLGYASLDNRGTESLGPWEFQLSGSANSVLTAFDRLQVSIFDTPNHPAEVVSPALFYDAPLDTVGTRIGFSVARTSLLPGGSLAAQNFDSTAMRYILRVRHPLLRSREHSLWISTSFDLLDSGEQSNGAPVFDDHLRVLRVTGEYLGADAAGNTTLGELEFSQGLSFLGASHPGQAGLSRSGGRADFTKVVGSLTREQVIARHWGIQLDLAGQKSAEPLLLSEQFALGGARFGRAYDPAEAVGDDALTGSLELRYGSSVESALLRSYQVYGFYDLGAVWDMESGGAPSSELSLASAGLGVRVWLKHNIAANLELAKALTRRVAADGEKPVRAFITVSAQF